MSEGPSTGAFPGSGSGPADRAAASTAQADADSTDSGVAAGLSPSAGSRGSVEVFVCDEQAGTGAVAVDALRWEALARAVLEAEGVTATGSDVELSLLFVDEGAMATLNERFMGRLGPTDVLSFPIDDDPPMAGRMPDNGPRSPGDDRGGEDDEVDDEIPVLLGDVVVCPAVAARNAADHIGPGHDGTLVDELALLVVHGVLHILGMNHEDDDDAEIMEARERELLRRFHRKTADLGPSEGAPS